MCLGRGFQREGASYGEGPVAPGPVLRCGPEWMGQEHQRSGADRMECGGGASR